MDDEQRYEEEKARAVERHVIGVRKLRSLALPQAFLFKDAIPKQGISFVSGPPGGSKSWVAYAATIAVARATPWLGREFVDTEDDGTSGALILNYDNPTPLMAQRYEQLGVHDDDPLHFHTLKVDDPNAELMRFPTDESDESREHIEQLKMVVAQLRPKLVLIDSFRQAHDGDENDSREIACVLRHVKRLLAYGATVMIIHHSAKASAGLRGTGEIEAAADAVIHIGGDEDCRIAQWAKHRGWPMKDEQREVCFRLVDQMVAGAKLTQIKLLSGR